MEIKDFYGILLLEGKKWQLSENNSMLALYLGMDIESFILATPELSTTKSNYSSDGERLLPSLRKALLEADSRNLVKVYVQFVKKSAASLRTKKRMGDEVDFERFRSADDFDQNEEYETLTFESSSENDEQLNSSSAIESLAVENGFDIDEQAIIRSSKENMMNGIQRCRYLSQFEKDAFSFYFDDSALGKKHPIFTKEGLMTIAMRAVIKWRVSLSNGFKTTL